MYVVKKRLIVSYKYVPQVKYSNKTESKQKERSVMCGMEQVWWPFTIKYTVRQLLINWSLWTS